MRQASFRFYAELNDFLPENLRYKRFSHRFHGQPGVKDVIEALGPPHPEIDLILINGSSVDFEYALQHADCVGVYPRFRTIEVSPLLHVRPPKLESQTFVIDTHLGRLAAYLRMLGFDTLYWNAAADESLAEISQSERRILLTRDRGLLKRSAVIYGYCVRKTHPREQLFEVVRHYGLAGCIQPFKRCMRCNSILEAVEKEQIKRLLPDAVRENYETFRLCPGCGRVYWQGSHYERMLYLIESLTDDVTAATTRPGQ